tara:strand:- start:492 stop:1604 length:1113 start_codon:yes stop_codon:yes gene_type:complete
VKAPAPFVAKERVLMGPGPSDVPSQVLRAQGAPTIGHLDPEFLRCMDECRAMIRAVYGTENTMTLPISGTGSAGMETLFANLLEPGDAALICTHGVFGGRMAEVARRQGAEVVEVKAPWGQPLDPEKVAAAGAGRRFRVLALVHAETSTGVLQDLAPFRAIADEHGALLVADCVTSFAGVPIELDRHGVDAAYSGTQKCLSAPPGLAPISLSERAMERVRAREHEVRSWYLDLRLLARYWGDERAYHHTAPVNAIFGLHEALRLVLTEGLEARYERHARLSGELQAGLRGLGLELPVAETHRLPPLTLVGIPDGKDDKQVRRHLLDRYGLEIGGGLGDFAGKAWRIGLMGASCTPRHIALCLSALEDALS